MSEAVSGTAHRTGQTNVSAPTLTAEQAAEFIDEYGESIGALGRLVRDGVPLERAAKSVGLEVDVARYFVGLGPADTDLLAKTCVESKSASDSPERMVERLRAKPKAAPASKRVDERGPGWKQEPKARILNNCDYDSSTRCLLWKGKTDKGYGIIQIDRRRRAVHRVISELEFGPSRFVRHGCQNRNCVNPEHLVPADSPTPGAK